MDKQKLEQFLIKARVNTYAGDGGKVKPALDGTSQLEFAEGDWFYRDVYYTGKNTFMGLDTVYYQNKPVFSNSYFGDWGEMTEEEIDDILRGALMANPESRLYKNVSWEKDGFIYSCKTDSFSHSIDKIGGYETISKDNKQLYSFYYAGSLLAK